MHAFRRAGAGAAAAALCSVLLLVAGPAGAVVGGQSDTSNIYANAGVLQGQFAPGEWFDYCSGTLVADNVVLTAAHCTDFLGPGDLRVSFEVDPNGGSTYYYADQIVVHPDWFTAPPCRGNSKRCYLAPPREDIALVWLSENVAGVTPAPVAGAGYLDALDLTSESFTVVGYGVDDFIKGNIISPHSIAVVDGVRSYRHVTAITEHDAFPDRFVKITQSLCFGDSGGPLFHDGTVVAIDTWTFSPRCEGPNLSYRVDAPTAQAFLDKYL